jgi:acyl-CoA synthetase (AMP-forming)/AMP-acid ligase II
VSDIEGLRLWQLVAQHAERSPSAVAVVDADGELTYGALADRAQEIESRLRRRGVSAPGSGLLLQLGASANLAAYYVAASRMRIVVVPLRSAWARPQISQIKRALSARVWHVDAEEDVSAAGGDQGAGLDCLYLNFTSGTTGAPKAVGASEAQIWSNARSATLARTLDSKMVYLCSFPPDLHPHEMWARPFLNGGTAVLLDQRAGVRTLWRRARHCGVTHLHGSPWFLELSTKAGRWSDLRPATLAEVESGGGTTSQQLADAFAGQSGLRFLRVWGSTETNGVVLEAEGAALEPSTLGRARPNYEVDIDGLTGEMSVRGRSVAKGYVRGLGDDENSGKFFESGRLRGVRTGDIVRSIGGFVHVVGRSDAMIKFAGQQIDLGLIERELLASTPESTGVLVRIRSDEGSERLIATFEVADPQVTAEQLRALLPERGPYTFPRIAFPHQIEVCSQLPRTSSGKVIRNQPQ